MLCIILSSHSREVKNNSRDIPARSLTYIFFSHISSMNNKTFPREYKYWLITVNKFFLISLWHRAVNWEEKNYSSSIYKERRWWEHHFNISTNTAHCTPAYEWGAHIKNIMKICRHPHVIMFDDDVFQTLRAVRKSLNLTWKLRYFWKHHVK